MCWQTKLISVSYNSRICSCHFLSEWTGLQLFLSSPPSLQGWVQNVTKSGFLYWRKLPPSSPNHANATSDLTTECTSNLKLATYPTFDYQLKSHMDTLKHTHTHAHTHREFLRQSLLALYISRPTRRLTAGRDHTRKYKNIYTYAYISRIYIYIYMYKTHTYHFKDRVHQHLTARYPLNVGLPTEITRGNIPTPFLRQNPPALVRVSVCECVHTQLCHLFRLCLCGWCRSKLSELVFLCFTKTTFLSVWIYPNDQRI